MPTDHRRGAARSRLGRFALALGASMACGCGGSPPNPNLSPTGDQAPEQLEEARRVTRELEQSNGDAERRLTPESLVKPPPG